MRIVLFLFISAIVNATTWDIIKECYAGTLHKELVEAGFEVNGVTCGIHGAKINLNESELKNPIPIVMKHVKNDKMYLVFKKEIIVDSDGKEEKMKTKVQVKVGLKKKMITALRASGWTVERIKP